MFVNGDSLTHFDSFGVEYIPKYVKQFTGGKNIIKHVYKIQANDLIMCGYFCNGFIDFMLKGKSLIDYSNLFSPEKYENNDTTTLKYFNNSKQKNYFMNKI